MKYLFFDTETTGLPKNYNAPASDTDNWPRLVQLAWLVTDEKGEVISKHNYIVKPDGFIIPLAASAVHGIEHSKALEVGEDLLEVLKSFAESMDLHKPTVVGHNVSFDINVLAAEFIRRGMKPALLEAESYCTMKETINFCDLPNKKYPKLIELHRKLFKTDFDGAHDALVDVLACAKCFFEYRNLSRQSTMFD